MGASLKAVLDAAAQPWKRAFDEAVAAAPSPEQAASSFERLAEAAGAETLLAWPAERLTDLAIILGSSAYFSRLLFSAGSDWPAFARRYELAMPSRESLVADGALDADDDAAALHRKLRRLAAAEMFRIGARDLLGVATLDETVTALTQLADVSICLALDHSRALLVRSGGGDAIGENGQPLGFVVLGMGKLGGGELNFSSDVDLVYMYESDAVAEGSRPAREFFTHLASAVTRAVGETTSDGVVFRVDLRLRPEGVNGLPVNPVEVALDYYEGWGDTWERGALAKARPVAGDLALGHRFLVALEPFIYRRHLDYDTVEDLRGMKDRIDAELALLKPGTRNVKIGRGGIRELEFVVQVLQLIHGGHVPAVRGAGTRRAIDALEAEGLLSSGEAAEMRDAYRFLRNVEHAVQVEEKRQTQTLPQRPEGLRTLARRLGYGTGRRAAPLSPDEVAGFEHDWDRVTHRVHELFVRFLELRPGEEARPEHAMDPMALAVLGQIAEGRLEDAGAILARMGIPGGEEAARNLARIYQGRLRGPASPQRRRAVEALAPHLLDAVARSSDPARALSGLVEFLIRTGAHTSYLALLGGSPKTMEILVSLFASSPYLAGHLVGHPELLDSLVRVDSAARPEPTADELREALHAALPADATDEEEILAALRRFRITELTRIGLGDLAGALSGDAVHRALSTLAEVILVAAVEISRRIVSTRVKGPWEKVHLAVLGMGKLGAREMSYGSDLDLIFVYESDVEGYDADTHVLVTKWMQKFISLLTARTRDGVVYEVDARLRPSGHSGPLATSLASFIDYHAREADLWERQALIRARVVYAGPELTSRIDSALAARVWGTSLGEQGMAEIAGLRSRVENELSGEESGRLNIKTGRGGIVDIEFVVQMLQLRHGAAQPRVRKRATAEAIEGLRDVGAVDVAEAEALLHHYRFLRRLEARLRLERDRPVEELGTEPATLAPLAVRLGYDGDDPGGQLLADYHRTREEVRALYERFFATAPAGPR
ncbi:MAG: bifunctional [glutamate--ammonia ligase]-adenylyl-L-tyrosine phosphorylase/[glutamate--ammonia-ligase] adenylyltransferase [Candidatus Binatia bacterium]